MFPLQFGQALVLCRRSGLYLGTGQGDPRPMVKKSVCLFCSLGCGLACRVEGREAVAIDYDRNNPVNLGALCPRGYYNYELLNHPGRLTSPSVGGEDGSWGEAASKVRRELQGIDPGSIGIVV